VGWNTYEALSQPCVQYGTSSDALTSEVCSTNSETYPTSRTHSNSVILTGLSPATTYYYKIVSTNSSVEHFVSPRTAGDKTPYAISVVIDLGVYGADGFTIEMDQTKRDTIPSVDPSLNHTTISRLATNINDYEFVVHPGDFGKHTPISSCCTSSGNSRPGQFMEAVEPTFMGILASQLQSPSSYVVL
jgi:hypothetical protein